MRIGIISDIHGNQPALEAVLAKLDLLEVENILCAGDIIGYYPFTNQVIECLKGNKITAIQGNHEGYLVGKIPISMERWQGCRLDMVEREITPENKKWLAGLPLDYRFEIDGIKYLLCHGSPWSLEEYIYPNASEWDRFNQLDENVVIMGHTHIPLKKQVVNKWLINPGSCGQPRDYLPTASFAVVDTKTQQIDLLRAEYNLQELIATLKAKFYPQPLIDILCRTK